MIKKLKNNKNALFLILMIIISCITQILTLMKSSIVAGIFGLSLEMDAFNFSNSIVSLIFGLVAAGIPTIIIPSYINKEREETINTFITIIYSFVFFVIILIILLRYQIIGLISNKNELFVNIACNILILLLLSQYLLSITNITDAYMQCKNKYNLPKIINLISQIIIVISLLIIDNISIYKYTFIISCGVLINFIFSIYFACKYGWRYKPKLLIRNKKVKEMLITFLPILFSSSVYKISLFVDSTIAARFDTGKLTILSYSNQIANIVNSVLIGNLILYAYPKIVEKIKNGNGQDYFWKQVNLFHSIVILVIIGFLSIGNEGVKILFQHGSFDDFASYSVYIGSSLYIFGQQNNVIRDLYYRYFYATGNTKITAQNSIIVSVLNIILSVILTYLIGFYGIIFGTVLASFISMIIIIIKFSSCFNMQITKTTIVFDYIRNNMIGLVTLLVVLFTKNIFPQNTLIASILLFGTETVLVYCILTFVFNKRIFYALKSL